MRNVNFTVIINVIHMYSFNLCSTFCLPSNLQNNHKAGSALQWTSSLHWLYIHWYHLALYKSLFTLHSSYNTSHKTKTNLAVHQIEQRIDDDESILASSDFDRDHGRRIRLCDIGRLDLWHLKKRNKWLMKQE